MKKILRTCLLLLCITALLLGLAACTGSGPVLAELGDGSDFTFYLDGIAYTMPVSLAELEANGWIASSSWLDIIDWGFDEETYLTGFSDLEPGENGRSVTLTNGDRSIYVGLFNPTASAIPLREGMIEFVSSGFEQTSSLIFPGSITVGSIYPEILTAYGEPSRRTGGSLHAYIAYGLFVPVSEIYGFVYDTEYAVISFSISTETNQVVALSVSYGPSRE